MENAAAKAMRRILASCPARRPAGFTLLELLVVMVLLALVSGLVLPRLSAQLSGAQERAWRGELREELARLPLATYREGVARQVDSDQLRQLMPSLPHDVAIETPQPLRYDVSGMASGGSVIVRTPGGAAEIWRVMPITGEVRLETAR